MPNFPSIYLELQESWKKIKKTSDDVGGLQQNVSSLETDVNYLLATNTVYTSGSIQGDGSSENPVRLTGDVVIPDDLIVSDDVMVSGSITLGAPGNSGEDVTINLGTSIGILKINNLDDASTTTNHKALVINTLTGEVRKENFSSVSAGTRTVHYITGSKEDYGESIVTVPSNATSIRVTCVGGGGGAGHGGTVNSSGAGGGGGYVVQCLCADILVGENIYLRAGKGGSGAVFNGPGEDGGKSWINYGNSSDLQNAIVIAHGGQGGNEDSADGADGSNNGSNSPNGDGGNTNVLEIDWSRNGARNASPVVGEPILAPGGGGGGGNNGATVLKGGSGGVAGADGGSTEATKNGQIGGNGGSITYSAGDVFKGCGGGGGSGGDRGYVPPSGELFGYYGDPGSGGNGGWPGGGGGGHGIPHSTSTPGNYKGGDGGGGLVIVEIWT